MRLAPPLRLGAALLLAALVLAAADDVYEKALHAKDPSLTCLGTGKTPGKTVICCHNCTSCCKDHNRCNLGVNNDGWANVGDGNFGDFNVASQARGDCNMEDRGFGIGSPSFDGCPRDVWDHIIKFCAINPYYHKCADPPYHYHDELAELLGDTVLQCDGSIQVKRRETRSAQLRRRRKQALLVSHSGVASALAQAKP